MRPASSLLLCLLLLTVSPAARAMRFAYYPAAAPGGEGMLAATGKVELGDDERLGIAIHALPAGTKLGGLLLNSPGGDLEVGLRLAGLVHEQHLPTAVAEGAMCASACFIVFVAGSHLSASSTALVGVHSASFRGSDTPDAQSATVRMVRRLADYGVPDAILGKLVTAQPSQVWWLTRKELESMRVELAVPALAAKPLAIDLPSPATAQAAAPAASAGPMGKAGFRVEPPAHGFQLAPRAAGFTVWQPGHAG